MELKGWLSKWNKSSDYKQITGPYYYLLAFHVD